MNPPDCKDHGTMMLELALGRLDDRPAADAETLLTSCPVCGEWWNHNLVGESASAVDAAVATAFASFETPRSRRAPVWLAAAAAIVVMVGATTVWRMLQPIPAVDGASTIEIVQRILEGTPSAGHDLNGDGAVDASDLVTSLLSSNK